MNDLIKIKESNIHGKGVFATTKLERGLILTCDVLIVDQLSKEHPLYVYQYPWLFKKNCICIGFGSYFNHSKEPNVRIVSTDKIKLTMSFILLKDVYPSSELFIDYGPSTFY